MGDKYIRKAFLMSVNSDCFEEYKIRHDQIWPELVETLRSHGARNYSIFLNEETGDLFAYVEIKDQQSWDKVADTEVCQKWWRFMKDIMPTNDDFSPVSKELKNVFFMK